MPSKASARPEHSQLVINVACLPRDEALDRARTAGRKVLRDAEAIEKVADTIWLNWVNVNMPVAVGQTDDEFGELLDAMSNEFYDGLSSTIKRCPDAATADHVLDCADRMLNDASYQAWGVCNVLRFMIEAMDEDTTEGLPVKCTLVDLHQRMDDLATNLMVLMGEARSAGDRQ